MPCPRRWPTGPDRCPATGNRHHHCHRHDNHAHWCRCGAAELDLT